MKTPLEAYRILETRINELKPNTRERLLYQLVGAITSKRCMDVSSLHLAILNLEKSAGEMK